MNEHSTTAERIGAASDNDVALRGTGAPAAELFVINLCASMTPMPSVPKSLKGFESYKLYQVSKMEDGRRRYRLRLGFFTSEADAELVVGSVRTLYPAAFTGCLCEEDLRYANGFGAAPQPAHKAAADKPTLSVVPPKPVVSAPPTVNQSKPAPVAAAPRPATPSATQPPAPQKASAPAKTAVTPSAPVTVPKISAPKMEDISLELDFSPPAVAAPPKSSEAATPFHVAKGIVVPEVSLELAPEPAAAVQAAPPVAPALTPVKTAPAIATSKQPPAAKAPKLDAPLPPPPRIVDDYIPVLDTTMTLRTLTQAEIEDPNQPTWYVVELAMSENPVNLDTMPKLDIFAAYSLYSVATLQSGGIRHALRLGFFREAVSAEAVAGYLKTFFNNPGVTRISAAEYSRFAEPPRKTPPADKSADKVVQLKDKRAATPAQPAAPASRSAHTAPDKRGTPAKPGVPINKPLSAAKPAVKGRPGSPRSLTDELREEARQTLLSESGVRKGPKPQSFLSRLIGRSLD